ncbi:hypothetical protein HA402_003159 [Bradysia odoriphaga]|nr:hypothetical protein HA402_003159 [Bradysia odoriphaga]
MNRTKEKNQNIVSPFNIHSIIGFNLKVAIKNLTSSNEHPTIVYASGHILTIRDCGNNGVEYLLGHERDVAYVGVAKACKMLVTSDENLVNIWERIEKKNSKFDTVLLKTFNDPFIDEPILATGLSVDGEYLVLASRIYIKLWILRHNNDKPDAIHELTDNFRINGKIVFCQNSNQSNNFMVATDTNLLFCKWNVQKTVFETHRPRQFPGANHIVDSSYCSNYCKGVSITKRSVIIWSDTSPGKEIRQSLFKNRMEFQFEMRLGFYQLQTVSCGNGFIIISDSTGEVKFHDENMRLQFSYQLCGEIVNSICFEQGNENYETSLESLHLSLVGTFFAACESGRMYKCNLNTKPSLICDSAPVLMTCFDLHPKAELLCGGRQDGQIFTYNYSTNTYDKYMSLPLALAKQLKLKPQDNATTCLSFSSCGRYIAAGTSNGFLAILNTITLTLFQKAVKLAEANVAIEKAIFSDNNEFIVYLDESCKVGLLHYVSSWKLIRKCRVHDSPIVYMSFRETEDKIGLVTISEDYKVADYTIRRTGSSSDADLTMTSCQRVDYLSLLKSCITLNRNIMAFPDRSGNDVAYLTTDEKFKFQIRDIDSLEVINTFAAPISDDEPITMMCHVNRKNENAIVFSTKNIIGLQHLPIDGNPNKYLAMVGHPRRIRHMKVSHCNKYLFTIGDDDSSVYMWNIKMSALLQQYRSGGTSLRPFCNLLPGGVTGTLFKDMQDIFFYIQIKAQKLESIDVEKIKLVDAIPVSQTIDFMRCIGFFPNDYRAECIMNEIKYYADDSTDHLITFENLMKIFVNYRPPFGYLKTDILETLKYLGYSYTLQSADTEITRERLAEICTSLGEEMDENDAAMYLNQLDGKEEIEQRSENDEYKFDNIKSLYTISEFMKYILGVE